MDILNPTQDWLALYDLCTIANDWKSKNDIRKKSSHDLSK